MIPPIAGRIPLVRRPKAPVLPLDERIGHLTGLTVEPAGASHHDLVARASGVLNYAALIASDLGMPDLATDLCWRQHRAFTRTGPLSGSVAIMALMPLVNISRLLTRGGDGDGAYEVLAQLYTAARQRSTTRVRGHDVDLEAFTGTETDHRKVCEELWLALLVDGARALARTGRWTEAEKALSAHRGIGNRLLDGRQILIMSLMEQGLDQQARETLKASKTTESWEDAIAALLRVYCHASPFHPGDRHLDAVWTEAATLLATPDPSTAVFHTRTGLSALDLTGASTDSRTADLCDAIVNVAALDASAAREALTHPVASAHLRVSQVQRLTTVLAASGIGTHQIPQAYLSSFTGAVEEADSALRRLLQPASLTTPKRPIDA